MGKKQFSFKELAAAFVKAGEDVRLHDIWVPAEQWVRIIKDMKGNDSKFDELDASNLNRAVPNRLGCVAYDAHHLSNAIGFYRMYTGSSKANNKTTLYLFTHQEGNAMGGSEWVEAVAPTTPVKRTTRSSKRPASQSPASSPQSRHVSKKVASAKEDDEVASRSVLTSPIKKVASALKNMFSANRRRKQDAPPSVSPSSRTDPTRLKNATEEKKFVLRR
jgi:hypothetical protein